MLANETSNKNLIIYLWLKLQIKRLTNKTSNKNNYKQW